MDGLRVALDTVRARRRRVNISLRLNTKKICRLNKKSDDAGDS